MFYTFYWSVNMNIEQLKQLIIETLSEGESVENSNHRLELSTSGFNLSLKEGGDGVRFKSEDYGIDFKFELWFDI
ncbi:hypothetical protein [Paenibacillus sp. 2003]|uniref:hypothetical protein n=1 Tax=Paenibacillus TaxID=44249 RepID=UPI00285F39FA|nr:hypothetical protein [Paenibacillus sp. 2003]MDR6720554.1 hypothetical protein [Paenibacillus sp. 2003]